MRIQGGKAGILAAIDAGRLDPLDPWLPSERALPNLTPTNLAKILKRERHLAHQRAKRLAAKPPF